MGGAQMTQHLIAALERDEGYRAEPYRDSLGIWTVAIGRNLEANPLTGAEWKQLLDAGEITVHISRAGAMRLLGPSVRDIEIRCATIFPWWRDCDDVRREVIANLAYNMGFARLAGFRNMLAAMQARDYERAADELADSRWYTQVGERGPRLVEQLRTGVRP